MAARKKPSSHRSRTLARGWQFSPSENNPRPDRYARRAYGRAPSLWRVMQSRPSPVLWAPPTPRAAFSGNFGSPYIPDYAPTGGPPGPPGFLESDFMYVPSPLRRGRFRTNRITGRKYGLRREVTGSAAPPAPQSPREVQYDKSGVERAVQNTTRPIPLCPSRFSPLKRHGCPTKISTLQSSFHSADRTFEKHPAWPPRLPSDGREFLRGAPVPTPAGLSPASRFGLVPAHRLPFGWQWQLPCPSHHPPSSCRFYSPSFAFIPAGPATPKGRRAGTPAGRGKRTGAGRAFSTTTSVRSEPE